MTTRTLAWSNDLASLQPALHELQSAGAEPGPLYQYELIRKWYECFCKDSPLILQLQHGGRCVGLYPMLMQRRQGARILRTLYNISLNICTPLVLESHRETFFSDFLLALRKSTLSWDFLFMEGLFSYEAARQQLDRALAAESALVRDVRKEPTFCVTLENDFQWYLKQFLSRNTSRDYKKKLNRISRHPGFMIEFLHDAEALAQYDAFVEIEDSGWKGEQGTSLKRAPAYYAYCKDLCRAYSEHGQLLMGFVHADGRRIGGVIGLVENDVCLLIRAGYLDSHAYFSPSNILFVATVQHLYEHRKQISLLNSFPFSYGYKHKYHHTRESCLTYVIVNQTLRAGLYWGAHALKKRLARARTPAARAGSPTDSSGA
jgi:CelD/BcsL family acetyltransferase involved in cellulose biosynthesis